MAGYLIEQKGDNRYIVEATGAWDKELKYERKFKKYIGKVDKKSLKLVFKDSFIKEYEKDTIILKGQTINIRNENFYTTNIDEDGNEVIKIYDKTAHKNEFIDLGDDLSLYQPISDQIRPIDISDFKSFGSTYLLEQISDKNNLTQILKLVFPKNWSFILNLVFFIIIENRKMDHCIEWADINSTLPSTILSSQNISVLFDKITAKERHSFYKKWIKSVKEQEFIALDITSVSSYSEKNDIVEFGHSKENNKLPQINICMLFGQKTCLPMYQTIYNGSLTDVSTLKSILNEFYGIFEDFNFKLVLDRGFYSFENIKYMLETNAIKFILGVPLTNNYANDLINNVFFDIDSIDNCIYTSSKGDTVKGIAAKIAINSNKISILNDLFIKNNNINSYKTLTAFVYYNYCKAIRDKNKFNNQYNDIKKDIMKNINKIKTHQNFIDKYMEITYSDGEKSIFAIKENKKNVESHLKSSGFSILVTNDDINISDCYKYYVKKDVVKKSFHNYKSYLGLDRPYVHGNKRMVNKSFVIFICQILYSLIYNIMLEKNLFRNYSIAKMFGKLNTLQTFSILDNKYLRPVPKDIKDIFKFFDIPMPKV